MYDKILCEKYEEIYFKHLEGLIKLTRTPVVVIDGYVEGLVSTFITFSSDSIVLTETLS